MSDFTLDKNSIYLNSGTLSKVPKVVLEALIKNIKEYEINPTYSLAAGWKRLWLTQKKVAQFFNAQPEDLFFRANVTAALNDFIMGIQLPEGEILVTDLEYGATVNICKLRAQQDQRVLRTIQLSTGDNIRSDDECVEQIVNQLNSDSKLLVISHVMTGTGLKAPIKKIAAETRKRNIILAVDGAHGPGACHLDFSELKDVDFYGGNFHKWMMAPKGTGFGWVPKRNQNAINSIQGSWTVFDLHPSFAQFGEEHSFPLRMLTSSCLDFANFFTLHDVIYYWEQKTEEVILQRLFSLRNFTEKIGQEVLSIPLFSPTSEALKSPLVSFALPNKYANKSQELQQLFYEKHQLTLAFPYIGNAPSVRFSAHIYNTETEIESAMKTLKKELF